MKCPIDNTDLVMSERQNIEIDYCPQCRGIWLDRGELDKIIERSQTERQAPQQSDQKPPQSYNKHGVEQNGYSKHQKRRGFLGELFD